MSQVQKLPQVLQSFIDSGVQVLTTKQAAAVIGLAPQTLRKWACYDTAPFSIRPLKIGRSVRWQIDDIARLLGGASHV